MDEKVIEDTFECQMKQCEIECTVPYGGVLLFSNSIVHCSYTNLSQDIRWSIDLRWQVWRYRLWSFKPGDTKLEIFLDKTQHTQRKLLNFEAWCNGEVSKSAQIWLSKEIFYAKNYWSLPQFFYHWKIPRSTFFVIDMFW